MKKKEQKFSSVRFWYRLGKFLIASSVALAAGKSVIEELKKHQNENQREK